MRRQVVHDDDVARIERRRQHLLDIGAERDGVHRSIERHWRGQGGAAQGGGEGCGQPMAMGDWGAAAATALRTTVTASHLGRGAGLVDEDELVGVEMRRKLAPGLAGCRDVGPILLGGVHGFF